MMFVPGAMFAADGVRTIFSSSSPDVVSERVVDRFEFAEINEHHALFHWRSVPIRRVAGGK
jgi:hypothetical protein